MRRLIASLFIFLASQAALSLAALSRVPAGPAGRLLSGYSVHVLAFFFTTASLFWVLSHERIRLSYALEAAACYSLLVAVLVEFLQRWLTDYRVFDWYDMLAGACGIAAFVLLELLVLRRFRQADRSTETG